ncbi:Uncharacterised protein [Kingella negevensis]|uniref:Uncharacterized protein n=1 Tax=Kingella negevensis TaxID=1522312 RepID=A0A238HIS1_9NEIS|nr:Uncharacterised protein [Kingella negevensis]
MKIVFLDQAGLRSEPLKFNFPHEYIEYPLT